MKQTAMHIANQMKKPTDGSTKELEIVFEKETIGEQTVAQSPGGCPCLKKPEEAYLPNLKSVKTVPPPDYELEIVVDKNESD